MMDEKTNNVTYFASANFRNVQKRFGIKRVDRTKHMYVIGKTGMGKTTLLENMALQDILNGEGLAYIDPHGDTAEKLLQFIPESRIKDVLYFNPSDVENPIGFNVMEDVAPDQRHLIANGMMGVFKKIWPDVWSNRMEYILNNCILALLEYPNSTILGINRLLSDKEYRKAVVNNITDSVVKAFWVDEFAKYSDKFMVEAGAAIQNKIGQFISNPLIRNIIGQPKSSFKIREVMDQKKIFIINLSKGRMGEENARLIGAMLITKIYLAAMSRVDIVESKRSDFYLYVDEFQNFATESFKDILSEARKYKLSLILAHQYIAQMDEAVRDAVFGNIGTIVSFRVGAFDAEVLEKEFSPEFYIQDIVNLGFASIYLKLMIDGVASRPFSATTLPPIQVVELPSVDKIITASRRKYSQPRNGVQEAIELWYQPIIVPKVAPKEKEELKKDTFPVPKANQSTVVVPDNRNQPELRVAVCAECGKETMVPFEPDGKRPVYCKTHRKSLENSNGEKSATEKEIIFTTEKNIVSSPMEKNVVKNNLAKNDRRATLRVSSTIEDRRVAPRAKSDYGTRIDREKTFRPEQKRISLKDLENKERSSNKTDELRELLQATMKEREDKRDRVKKKEKVLEVPVKKEEKASSKSGVLKPGEKITF